MSDARLEEALRYFEERSQKMWADQASRHEQPHHLIVDTPAGPVRHTFLFDSC